MGRLVKKADQPKTDNSNQRSRKSNPRSTILPDKSETKSHPDQHVTNMSYQDNSSLQDQQNRYTPGALQEKIEDTTRNFYTLYSGSVQKASREGRGEIYYWRDDFDFYKDTDPDICSEDGASASEGKDRADSFMTKVATRLGLGRGQKLFIKPNNEVVKKTFGRSNTHPCQVPTPPKRLSAMCQGVILGRQEKPGGKPMEDCTSQGAALLPTWDSLAGSLNVPKQTSSLAQKFIEQPPSRWLCNRPSQLRLEVPLCRKMLIWARMMLLNREDREFLQRADVYRGILASIYRCRADASLVAAFLTFWNVDGHTLLTSQGEMGYPLHTIYDAMGIPFTGRLYEEFIPLSSTFCSHVRSLHTIYANCMVAKSGEGSVTISAWVSHFFDDKADTFGSIISDGFADPGDPLLEKLGFRVEIQGKRPAVILSKETLTYRVTYSSIVYRAAFIAAWLCTYCIPVEAGQYIRPEVFTMAVKIAKGERRAIGVASLAFLYRSLDEVHYDIMRGSKSASACSLFIPGHFLMGWFASFWKDAPVSASLSCPVKFPPFVIDFRDVDPIDLEEAHHLFWDFDDSCMGLQSLDFLGRSSIRFPPGEKAICIRDTRTNFRGHYQVLSISAVDLLVSCSVGGVTHRRGEHFDNRVYCPHRFARMFNCDQLIPDFLLRAEDRRTNSLDFRNYVTNTRDESFQILQRRHLSYYRPEGHTFFVQPLARGTRCSYNYLCWCNEAFKFLQSPHSFFGRFAMPSAVKSAPASNTEEPPSVKHSKQKGQGARRPTAAAAANPEDKNISKEISAHIEQTAKPSSIDSSADQRKIVQCLSAADAAPLGQQQRQKTLAVVPKHGQGKDIEAVRARLREGSGSAISSPRATSPASHVQSPRESEISDGDTELIDSESSDEGLAVPQDNLTSLPPEVFDVHESVASLLKNMADSDKRTDPTPQGESGHGAQVERVNTPKQTTVSSAPLGADQLRNEGTTDSPQQEVDMVTQQPVQSNTDAQGTRSVSKRKTDVVGNTVVSEPKRKKTAAPAETEELEVKISESEKLWASIEDLASKLKTETYRREGLGETSQSGKFDARKPVILPKLMGDLSPRFVQYMHNDLKRFQSEIRERPVNKEKVVSEVDGNLNLWEAWFKDKPIPPEVKRMMDGFGALKEALTQDPQTLAASIASKRDRVREKAGSLKTSYDTVMTVYATMSETSQAIKEQLALRERRIEEHSARAQGLQAQIAELTRQLKQVEADRDQEVALKERTTKCQISHDGHLSQAAVLKSKLEAITKQDHDQLQDLDETVAHFTDLDSTGLSKHACSLLDFFMACTSE
ncbi:hypothetical protein ACP70R_046585 [Stipagrostis hirtigluma subsp. patula]